MNNYNIGNLVTWVDSEHNAPLTITGIIKDECVWVEWFWEDGSLDNTDCDISSIKGIELDEHWLGELGFHQESKWNRDGLVVFPKDELIFPHGKTYFYSVVIFDKQPQYVHELQNLYFALIGKPLNIIFN